VIAIIFVAGIGLLIWSMNRHGGEGLNSLSAEDVKMIVEDQAKDNPRALASLSSDKDAREKVLRNIKEALAVAAEARKTGYAETPDVKMQIALTEQAILAQAYEEKLKADAGRPDDPGPAFGYINDDEVKTFFDAPANKAKYDAEQEKFLTFVQESQKKGPMPQEMSDDQKTYLTQQWKKVTYGAIKAKELNLATRRVELQYKLQSALILARGYTQDKLKDQLTPTDDEVKAYVASNPKFDKSSKKAKAEEVLAKVKAGGDFAALANQFSEDRGNKDPKTGEGKGGALGGAENDGFMDRSGFVKEFSDAAWALEPGQISDLVETQFGFHIIKLEAKRTAKDKDGKDQEQVKARHILISTMYEGDEQNPMMSMMSMDDAARQELAKQKQKDLLDGIIARNPITLPDDFTVDVPADKPDAGNPMFTKPPHGDPQMDGPGGPAMDDRAPGKAPKDGKAPAPAAPVAPKKK
jgi:parvulin-like peptidyl-prolyl isomerase